LHQLQPSEGMPSSGSASTKASALCRAGKASERTKWSEQQGFARSLAAVG
jgi:hypothetical protein